MNSDFDRYAAYLLSKHYAQHTVDNAVSFVKRLLKTCTVEEIKKLDTDQLMERLGARLSSSSSRDWYKFNINLIKRYLKTEGGYI